MIDRSKREFLLKLHVFLCCFFFLSEPQTGPTSKQTLNWAVLSDCDSGFMPDCKLQI